MAQRNLNATAIPAVPVRTPLYEPGSAQPPALARTWIMFFEELVHALEGVGGSVKSLIPQTVHEIPAGLINGANRVFTLSSAPLAAWLLLHLDNALQDPVADYALSGNQITYASAPQPGDTHHAWYLVGSTSPATPASAPVKSVTAKSNPGAGLTFYNGLSAAPAGWQNPGFDDSAWSAPVAQTLIALAPPAYSSYITAAAATGGSIPAGAQFLHRQSFVVGAGAVSSLTLKVNADNYVMGLWINGVSVYAPGATGTFLSAIVALSAANITAGANIVAIQVQNNATSGSNPIALDFVLQVS